MTDEFDKFYEDYLRKPMRAQLAGDTYIPPTNNQSPNWWNNGMSALDEYRAGPSFQLSPEEQAQARKAEKRIDKFIAQLEKQKWAPLPKPAIPIVEIARTGIIGTVGVGGEAAVAAYNAPKDHKMSAAINAAQEAIAKGSTTAGADICKITGVGLSGAMVWGASSGTFLASGGPLVPWISVPATMVVGSVTAGYAPKASKGIESVCNAVVPESVKEAVSTALNGTLQTAVALLGGESATNTALPTKLAEYKGK